MFIILPNWEVNEEQQIYRLYAQSRYHDITISPIRHTIWVNVNCVTRHFLLCFPGQCSTFPMNIICFFKCCMENWIRFKVWVYFVFHAAIPQLLNSPITLDSSPYVTDWHRYIYIYHFFILWIETKIQPYAHICLMRFFSASLRG